MKLPTYFSDFLTAIRPTDAQNTEYRDAHLRLRERMRNFEPLKDALVSDFLNGSYRRRTLHRPVAGKKADVDVIIVTKLAPEEFTPETVLKMFATFAEEHYSGKWKLQGRSVGITLSDVCLDLVPTAAPSEKELGILQSFDLTSLDGLDDQGVRLEKALRASAELWKLEPLQIPDREAKKWQPTNPLAQIAWTQQRNANSGGHYVNVIKALKWLKTITLPDLRGMKGYPLERALGECFSIGDVGSVAEGLVSTMETFVAKFTGYRLASLVPYLPDYGLAENVMKRVTAEQFAAFFDVIASGAIVARAALDCTDLSESAQKWRELLGDRFPDPPADETDRGGFTPRTAPSVPRGGRFA